MLFNNQTDANYPTISTMTYIDVKHQVINLMQQAFPTTWLRKLQGTMYESFAMDPCLQILKIETEMETEEEDDEDPGQKCYYRRFKYPEKPPGQPVYPKCADCPKDLEMDNKSTICIRCIWKTAWLSKRT
jgi:hypothetical protein